MQQAREKFMSLRKSTKIDVATVVEEVGHVAFFLAFSFMNVVLAYHGLPLFFQSNLVERHSRNCTMQEPPLRNLVSIW